MVKRFLSIESPRFYLKRNGFHSAQFNGLRFAPFHLSYVFFTWDQAFDLLSKIGAYYRAVSE